MLIKDLKGQAAFTERSAGEAGRSCEIPLGGSVCGVCGGDDAGVEHLSDGLYLDRKSMSPERKSSFVIC